GRIDIADLAAVEQFEAGEAGFDQGRCHGSYRSRRGGIVTMQGIRARDGRIARMKRWYGKVLGFIAGWLLMRHPAGGLVGLLIGHAFDSDWFRLARNDAWAVLGLEQGASATEVDLAYRRLM